MQNEGGRSPKNAEKLVPLAMGTLATTQCPKSTYWYRGGDGAWWWWWTRESPLTVSPLAPWVTLSIPHIPDSPCHTTRTSTPYRTRRAVRRWPGRSERIAGALADVEGERRGVCARVCARARAHVTTLGLELILDHQLSSA